jgi:cellulose synthase/poly-beta-1,6-N-acetylglucosamine synthase-like glycosyltransferase
MPYEPTFPTPFGLALLGIFIRSTKLLSAAPELEYTVIVPVYNKRDTVESTIRSIQRQTRKPHEIIIVNDGSTDGTTEILQKYAEKRGIRYIRFPENHGKAYAINYALAYVKTPFVLIVDADTYLAQGFAHNAMRGFYSKDVVGVCGKILPSKTFTTTQKTRLVEYLYGQRTYKPLQTKYKGLWVLTGCATMWRTWWLLKNGGIPKDTLVEDLELTWKAQKKHLVNYNPDAICFTEDPETFKAYLQQIERWFSWRPAMPKHFKEIRKGLKFTILWVLGESLSFLIYLAIMIYLLTTFQWLFVILMLLIDTLILTIITYIEARKIFMVKQAMAGIPRYFFIRYVNASLFFKALIKPKNKW